MKAKYEVNVYMVVKCRHEVEADSCKEALDLVLKQEPLTKLGEELKHLDENLALGGNISAVSYNDPADVVNMYNSSDYEEFDIENMEK